MPHRMFSALALALALAAPLPTQAQPRQCAARATILATLGDTFRETRRGMGVAGATAGATAVVELFASAETGTWTITITLPNGRTCLIASGQGWEGVVEEVPAKGDPA